MLSIRLRPSAHQFLFAADRVLIAVLLVAALVATPARGQSPKLFSPDEMTSGALSSNRRSTADMSLRP